MPGWLIEVLGGEWPEGSETAVEALGNVWIQAADRLEDVRTEGVTVRDDLFSHLDAESEGPMREWLDSYLVDADGLPGIIQDMRDLAEFCFSFANNLRTTKNFIRLMILEALLSLPGGLNPITAGIAVAKALAKKAALRALLKKAALEVVSQGRSLVSEVSIRNAPRIAANGIREAASEGGRMAGMDAAAQAMSAPQNRSSQQYDVGRTLQTGATGAASGAGASPFRGRGNVGTDALAGMSGTTAGALANGEAPTIRDLGTGAAGEMLGGRRPGAGDVGDGLGGGTTLGGAPAPTPGGPGPGQSVTGGTDAGVNAQTGTSPAQTSPPSTSPADPASGGPGPGGGETVSPTGDGTAAGSPQGEGASSGQSGGHGTDQVSPSGHDGADQGHTGADTTAQGHTGVDGAGGEQSAGQGSGPGQGDSGGTPVDHGAPGGTDAGGTGADGTTGGEDSAGAPAQESGTPSDTSPPAAEATSGHGPDPGTATDGASPAPGGESAGHSTTPTGPSSATDHLAGLDLGGTGTDPSAPLAADPAADHGATGNPGTPTGDPGAAGGSPGGEPGSPAHTGSEPGGTAPAGSEPGSTPTTGGEHAGPGDGGVIAPPPAAAAGGVGGGAGTNPSSTSPVGRDSTGGHQGDQSSTRTDASGLDEGSGPGPAGQTVSPDESRVAPSDPSGSESPGADVGESGHTAGNGPEGLPTADRQDSVPAAATTGDEGATVPTSADDGDPDHLSGLDLTTPTPVATGMSSGSTPAGAGQTPPASASPTSSKGSEGTRPADERSESHGDGSETDTTGSTGEDAGSPATESSPSGDVPGAEALPTAETGDLPAPAAEDGTGAPVGDAVPPAVDPSEVDTTDCARIVQDALRGHHPGVPMTSLGAYGDGPVAAGDVFRSLGTTPEVYDRTSAPEGTDLEDGNRAYDDIESRLRELGDGASAVVTSNWTSGTATGGHAYLAHNDGGRIVFEDPTNGESHAWPPTYSDVGDVAAGYIGPDGHPVDPATDGRAFDEATETVGDVDANKKPATYTDWQDADSDGFHGDFSSDGHSHPDGSIAEQTSRTRTATLPTGETVTIEERVTVYEPGHPPGQIPPPRDGENVTVTTTSVSAGDDPGVRNTATWTAHGDRTVNAEITLRHSFEGMGRTSAETSHQSAVSGGTEHGAVDGDHAGHVVAHRFILDQGLHNLFAQNGNFNTSAYKKMENEWAALVGDGIEVEGTIRLSTDTDSARPSRVRIEFEGIDPKADRQVVFEPPRDPVFDNAAGQEYRRTYKQ